MKKEKTDIQTKLLKSQTSGLWVSSIFSIIISLISLSISLLIYRDNEKESALISISYLNDDYPTGTLFVVGPPKYPTGKHLKVKYKATIINLSKNPLTIVSYFYTADNNYDSIIDNNLMNKINISDYFSHYQHKLETPLKIEPGDSKDVVFNGFVVLDSKTYLEVRDQYGEASNIVKFIENFYKHGRDFFGNPINYACKDKKATWISFNPEDLRRDTPFLFIIKTAKNGYFFQNSGWYSTRPIKELPFRKWFISTKSYEIESD